MNKFGAKIGSGVTRNLPKDCWYSGMTQEQILDLAMQKAANVLDIIEIHAAAVEDLEHYKQHLGKIEFGVHLPHSGYLGKNQICFCATDPFEIRKVEYWINESQRIARKLKAKYLALHPDSIYDEGVGKHYAEDRDSGFRQLIENLKKFEFDIPVLVETMPNRDYFCWEENELLRLKEEVADIGFLFDIEHAYTAKEQDIEKVNDFYNMLGKDIKVIHVCDFNGKRGHLPLGQGIIDFENSFLSNVKDKILVLEVAFGKIEDYFESMNYLRSLCA